MVDIGIIGLAKSGRTTVFNALTKGKTDTGGVASPTRIAKVPEPRLKRLADMLHPKRVVPAEVTYHDIGASAKGLVKEKGISDQFLAQLSHVDALINVVRAFTDESIPHIEGSHRLANPRVRGLARVKTHVYLALCAQVVKRIGVAITQRLIRPHPIPRPARA